MTGTGLLPFQLARRTDPVTSKRAAHQADDLRARHRRLIVEAIRAAGRPLAAEEVADRVPEMDKVQVAKRWKDLESEGLVRRTEERHQNRSGRAAFRYEVKR